MLFTHQKLQNNFFVNFTIALAVSDENFHASYQLNIGSNLSTV